MPSSENVHLPYTQPKFTLRRLSIQGEDVCPVRFSSVVEPIYKGVPAISSCLGLEDRRQWCLFQPSFPAISHAEDYDVSPLSLNRSNTVRLNHSIKATKVAENKIGGEHNYRSHEPNLSC